MFGGNAVGLTDSRMLLIATSVVIFGATWYYTCRRRNKPPKNWRKVGALSDLMCFPIKSCGAIKLAQAECVQLGLKSGFLRDRVFMVVDDKGNFITGRTMPKLTQLQPSVKGSKLILQGPDMPDISIDINSLNTLPTSQSKVWGQQVQTIDCGDEVANWLARFLVLKENTFARLVYYPSATPSRAVRPNNKVFNYTSDDGGALPDATSFNLISEASLEDLNTRVDDHIIAETFRGNFVVRGGKPYEEDDWKWVKIGSSIFENVKPCTRCTFTTVNPETGTMRPSKEPLKTLTTYRQLTDPKLVKFVGTSPVFGVHLALRVPGSVSVGDDIYVA